MSFSSHNGTRGARQPGGGALMRWGNAMYARRIKRKGASTRGSVLVLTTIGKKTGVERETPVRWFPGPQGSWLVVASAGGAARNPSWYYNLAAHPDRARINVGGEDVSVTATQLHDEERRTAWEQIVAAAPRFADYEVKTDRVIPVLRLVRRDEAGLV